MDNVKLLESLVEQGRDDEIKEMLQYYSNPSKELIDDYGLNFLHLATQHNKLDLLKYLLDIGFDVNSQTFSGATPLMIASIFNRLDAMKILLEWNANIFLSEYKDKKSTLEYVMSTINRLLVDERIYFETLIAEKYQKNTWLDSETKAEILVKAGCSFDFVVHHIKDPVAVKKILKTMSELGIRELSSAVKFFMYEQDMQTVAEFFEYVDRSNMQNELFSLLLEPLFLTSLQVCDLKEVDLILTRMMEWELFSFLLKPLLTTDWKHSFYLKKIELVLKRIMKLDLVDRCAMKCLELLFKEGINESVQMILHTNIDMYIRKKFGVEILVNLFYNFKVDVVQIIRNREFSVNGKNSDGFTALHIAINKKYFRNYKSAENIIRFLLNIGADPNVRDVNGITPLYENVNDWNQVYGELLLIYGADVQLDTQACKIFDRLQSRLYNILEIFIAKLVLDDAQGIQVDKRFYDKITYVPNYEKIWIRCVVNIKTLKECKIEEDSMTLFSLLIGKPDEIARHFRDESYITKLRNICSERKIHDFYQTMMKFKLVTALNMWVSKCNLAKIVSQQTGILVDSDHLVVEKIFAFLNYSDMLQLTPLSNLEENIFSFLNYSDISHLPQFSNITKGCIRLDVLKYQ